MPEKEGNRFDLTTKLSLHWNRRNQKPILETYTFSTDAVVFFGAVSWWVVSRQFPDVPKKAGALQVSQALTCGRHSQLYSV